MTGNYPLMSQSEWDKAPFNKDINIPKKVKVTVSITLSKTVEVEVTDYTTEDEVDEDNNHTTIYNFSDCGLKQAVKDQVILPNEAYNEFYHLISSYDINEERKFEDLKDWCVDDFEVIEE